jgi:hypothetical protein
VILVRMSYWWDIEDRCPYFWLRLLLQLHLLLLLLLIMRRYMKTGQKFTLMPALKHPHHLLPPSIPSPKPTHRTGTFGLQPFLTTSKLFVLVDHSGSHPCLVLLEAQDEMSAAVIDVICVPETHGNVNSGGVPLQVLESAILDEEVFGVQEGTYSGVKVGPLRGIVQLAIIDKHFFDWLPMIESPVRKGNEERIDLRVDVNTPLIFGPLGGYSLSFLDRAIIFLRFGIGIPERFAPRVIDILPLFHLYVEAFLEDFEALIPRFTTSM